MRIVAEFLLEKNRIDRDNNKIFIAILKKAIEKYDKDVYKSFFEMGAATKPYCFSLYIRDAALREDEIVVPGKKIVLKISTISLESGVHIYNALVQSLKRMYHMAENSFKLHDVQIEREKKIYVNEAIFTALSPVVVRKYAGNDRRIHYFSLNEPEGRGLLRGNLKKQLLKEFGEDCIADIEGTDVEVLLSKEVSVRNYGTEVLANLCKIRVVGKPYILNHIYKAGLGGHKRTGFGMLDLR